tara:strand:+ start:1739 stop:1873 length:135 start_codon:yes stop_codon:yes gene_type:complete
MSDFEYKRIMEIMFRTEQKKKKKTEKELFVKTEEKKSVSKKTKK